MLFDPTKPFAEELARLQAAGKISTNLTATQRAAIEASIRKYAGEAASQSAKTIAERFQATMGALADGFARSSGEMSEAARNLSATAEELSAQAAQLEELIAGFQLGIAV